MPLRHSRQIVSAWPYYRASCEIDGIIAGAKRTGRPGNSHPGNLSGFIATPMCLSFTFSCAVTNRIEYNL